MDDIALTREELRDKDLLTKMVDSLEETSFSIKHSSIHLPHSTLRIIISIKTFNEVFELDDIPYRLIKPLKRRVTEIDFNPFLQNGHLPVNSTFKRIQNNKIHNLPTKNITQESLFPVNQEKLKVKKRGRPLGSKNKPKKQSTKKD